VCTWLPYIINDFHKNLHLTISVKRLATGWTVRRSNPWTIFSETVQTGTGAHPASCTMDTGFRSRG
jgi:hypothetical protein